MAHILPAFKTTSAIRKRRAMISVLWVMW